MGYDFTNTVKLSLDYLLLSRATHDFTYIVNFPHIDGQLARDHREFLFVAAKERRVFFHTMEFYKSTVRL
jgi:hypothetical protein